MPLYLPKVYEYAKTVYVILLYNRAARFREMEFHESSVIKTNKKTKL